MEDLPMSEYVETIIIGVGRVWSFESRLIRWPHHNQYQMRC
jgi:hypothetical protein